MNRLRYILLSAMATLTFSVLAEDTADFSDDRNNRENPESMTDSISVMESEVCLSNYPFINIDNNVIRLNGADWSGLADALQKCDSRQFRILHIGDSHVQADMSTGYTRELLQNTFCSAGRGLIVPLKLAGTNEPRDYIITSTSSYEAEKLLAFPWANPMGFTGVSITPNDANFDFTLSANEPFERVFIFYSGSALNVDKVIYHDSPLVYAVNDYSSCVEIGLPFPCEEISIGLSSFGGVNVHGFELISDLVGVSYNAIGINGATFASYNRIDDFGKQLSQLEPQLIIVSLGTNESFGRLIPEEFTTQIDHFVSDIRAANPEAALLLVTPAECQRRGSRKRKASFSVNDRVATVRQLILNYGRSNGIPVYDWYEVAGGSGSSSQWVSAGLFSRDRIHYSLSGYRLQGRIFYETLLNALN